MQSVRHQNDPQISLNLSTISNSSPKAAVKEKWNEDFQQFIMKEFIYTAFRKQSLSLCGVSCDTWLQIQTPEFTI